MKEFADCPFKIDKKLMLDEALKVDAEMRESKKKLSDCEIDSELKEQLLNVAKWCAGKVVLTTYETMRMNSLALGCIDFSLVILDEAQKIKNIGVLQSNAAKALKGGMCIAMTGTPIENSLMDLWGIMDFVLPGHLTSKEEFKKEYSSRASKTPAGSEERLALKTSLETALSPVWFRRTKMELIRSGKKTLPSITHFDSDVDLSGSVTNRHLVKMTATQKDLYDGYVGYYNSAEKGQKLAALRSMIEVCAAPWLATNDEFSWNNRNRLFDLSPKLKITIEILEQIRSRSEKEGRKVIIFANIKEIQRNIAFFIFDWNRNTSKQRIEVEVYNGDLPGDSRKKALDRFKSADGFQVIIISPKAGGAGLNIVEANHVIHYTREWNPALEKQATDRVYRIGQTRPVFVYYPTTAGLEIKSAEEHLADVLQSKRDIMEDFTICPADTSGTKRIRSSEPHFGQRPVGHSI